MNVNTPLSDFIAKSIDHFVLDLGYPTSLTRDHYITNPNTALLFRNSL